MKFLQLTDLLEFFAHIVHNDSCLVGLLFLFVSILFFVLTVYQFLEEIISKAFHQIEFILEYDDTVIGFPICIFSLASDEFSHFTHLLEKWKGDFQLAIKSNNLKCSIHRIKCPILIVRWWLIMENFIESGLRLGRTIPFKVDGKFGSIAAWDKDRVIMSKMLLILIILFPQHCCFIIWT